MSRPHREKKIGKMPSQTQFYSHNKQPLQITLSLEEYETLRLIDYLGYNQQQCSESMGIGRSSVVSLYANARKKLSRFIIEGGQLNITGGNYLYDQKEGKKNMKVAITCVNGEVFQHFGHCPSFLICTIVEGKIVKQEMLDVQGKGCSMLASYLKENGVDIVICGGIGAGAKNHIVACGMEVLPGASGNALEQVESYIKGNLSYDPNTECDHHHGEDHNCGHHQEFGELKSCKDPYK